jgi:hypothetical protein
MKKIYGLFLGHKVAKARRKIHELGFACSRLRGKFEKDWFRIFLF